MFSLPFIRNIRRIRKRKWDQMERIEQGDLKRERERERERERVGHNATSYEDECH